MGSAPWQPADLDSSRPVVDVVVFNWRPVAVRPDATLCAACLRLVNGSGRRMYCALHVDQVYISAARASLCAANFFCCADFLFILCRPLVVISSGGAMNAPPGSQRPQKCVHSLFEVLVMASLTSWSVMPETTSPKDGRKCFECFTLLSSHGRR